MKNLPKHFFVSSTDGCLYDTRKKNWHEKPLRYTYWGCRGPIKNTADLKAMLRQGDYAWPGGYGLIFLTNDGAALCFKCVRENLYDVLRSINNDCNDGWRVIDKFVNYEDENCYCGHCNKRLKAEYEG